ncbi:helix-turn-helix domain-containing protein [Streptomyces qinzhouensis]|nr:helix-turn-helix transcriptional regulator [Streptomyces qinzhouensis]
MFAARTHANLTQQWLAEAAGMDRSDYQRIEYGIVSPRLDTLLTLADALGVPLSELVREDDDRPEVPGSGS